MRIFEFLRHRYYGNSNNISEQEIMRRVEEGIDMAERLKIEDEKNLIRFIEIQFKLSQEQLASLPFCSLLIKALTNLEWNEKKRLNFVYKHILSSYLP